MTADELLEKCREPERLARRVDKHFAQAALMSDLMKRREIEGQIAELEALEREIAAAGNPTLGDGECDGFLSELRFELAEINRKIAANPQS